MSPNAIALVGELLPRVAATEGRKTQRRQIGLAKLQGAVGAIVGGVLRRWSRDVPEAVYRSRAPDDFTGGPVPARQFTAAIDGLVSVGLIHQSRSVNYLAHDFGDGETVFDGKARRYWPSADLLALAAQRGVTPATVATDFAQTVPTTPPKVAQPLRLFSLKQRGQRGRQPLPLSKLGADVERLRRSVHEANAFAAQHDVSGCLPPRWYRVFTECSLLDGRWQAAGIEGLYQLMPEAERIARIRINGEAVAEVDVKASQLSILHGLLGLPLPEGDPYEFPDVPRSVVKSWILATMGKGSPVTRWARKAVKGNPELQEHDPKQVGQIVCNRYPFLRKPADAVCVQAGLDKLAHIAKPAKLLTHRLMAIEAEAIGGAMQYLRSARGILALPIHDSLIVPQSGVGYAGGALESAFSYFAKARVRWTVDRGADMPRA
jgi:hypothetical protein